jgi:hypothetical protein
MSRLENPLLLDGHAHWLSQARQLGGQHWVANAPTQVCCSDAGTPAIPVTRLTRQASGDSYVASPRAAWLHYPQAEAARHGRTTRLLAAAASAPLAGLISAARLDSAWHVNNWLLSTNLHPQWGEDELTLLTDTLLARQPEAPLLLRNVCDAANPGLPAMLQAQGWLLLPARQVYLCQPADPAVWRSPNVKRDQKLLQASPLTMLGPDQLGEADIPALQRCFRQLFIDKHSALNPDFTPAFFRLCLQQRFLELHALALDGQIVACIGLYQRYGWLTTPLLGYDTSLPAELGLYRQLMALLLAKARERELALHYSSGAGEFKRRRGGVPQLEYTAVFAHHLHGRHRLALSTLASLLQRTATPLLQRYG